jgi:hypothetical protein
LAARRLLSILCLLARATGGKELRKVAHGGVVLFRSQSYALCSSICSRGDRDGGRYDRHIGRVGCRSTHCPWLVSTPSGHSFTAQRRLADHMVPRLDLPPPGNSSLWWLAQLDYSNAGSLPITLTCSGGPFAADTYEDMSGTGNAGRVFATETFSTRRPQFSATLSPGGNCQRGRYSTTFRGPVAR